MSSYPAASYTSVILDTSDEHGIYLTIEAEETPQNKYTGNLKDDDLFLFNDEIKSKNDEQIEKK